MSNIRLDIIDLSRKGFLLPTRFAQVPRQHRKHTLIYDAYGAKASLSGRGARTEKLANDSLYAPVQGQQFRLQHFVEEPGWIHKLP
jgi:hypothetical protein